MKSGFDPGHLVVQRRESRAGRFLSSLGRQAWIVFLVTLVAIGTTLAVVDARAPVYRASTTLVAGTRLEADGPFQLAPSGLVRTMQTLLASDVIAREVIRSHRLDTSVEGFRDGLHVDAVPDAGVLRVAYESTEPRLALGIAADINRIFTRHVSRMLGTAWPEAGGRAGSFDVAVRVFDPPHLEPEPAGPSARATLILGGLAGLLLGVLLAGVREALDSRIRSRRDAEAGFGAPVLGAIPKGINRRPAPGVTVDGSPDDRAAALDLLRARLQLNRGRNGGAGSTVLVTSAGPRTGKAAVAANLAAALSRAGERVVCVDADLRRPALHEYLGTPAEGPGLVDVLESSVALDDALIRIDLAQPATNGTASAPPRGRLDVLQAGSRPLALDGLTLETVDRLLSLLRERADYVVLDAPTLLVSDVFPLIVKSDDVLLVARHGRTTKSEAESARRTLEGLGVENVGVVLTEARPADASA